MGSLRYVLIVAVIVFFALPTHSQNLDILSADWSVRAKPSVVEKRFDNGAVAEFMNTFWDDPEDPLKADQVSDFRWIDIERDGVYELLVIYSGTASPRRFFGGPAIFKVIAGKKVWYQTLSGDVSKLDGVIEDSDEDGTPELILPIWLTNYRGARPLARWTAVYKWNGEKYEDTSEQFREFYQKRILPDLEARIHKLSEPLPSDATDVAWEVREEELAAAWMERDKIARVTGEDPLAGVERARAWVKSSNPEIRRNAVSVFEDLGDKNFTADLQVLAADLDPTVARAAQIRLELSKKKRP